jgi:hypothetical protein
VTVPPETVYRLDFESSLTVAMTLPGRGVGAHPVDLARQVPLLHGGTGRRELDESAVQVAGRGHLSLRADAVLEPDVEPAAKAHDVVRLGKVLGFRGALAVWLVAVLQRRAQDDLLDAKRLSRGAGAGRARGARAGARARARASGYTQQARRDDRGAQPSKFTQAVNVHKGCLRDASDLRRSRVQRTGERPMARRGPDSKDLVSTPHD